MCVFLFIYLNAMPLSVRLVSSRIASNPNLTYIASISRSLVELWESPFICSAISSRPVSVIKKLSCYPDQLGACVARISTCLLNYMHQPASLAEAVPCMIQATRTMVWRCQLVSLQGLTD